MARDDERNRTHDDRSWRENRDGRNDGPWDEGQAGERQYGQGMYGRGPGTQGQQSGQWRGESGSPGWGSYSRGSDLGRAADRRGDTGDEQYGGGGFRGGSGYGGSGGSGGSMGTPSMPWQGHEPSGASRGSSAANHTGRGPKGWTRSDDRIRDDVSEQLERHPEIDASEIEVQVQSGEVTLTGTVTERHAKRMAEDVAEAVSGVRDVQNQIRVVREGSHGGSQRGA